MGEVVTCVIKRLRFTLATAEVWWLREVAAPKAEPPLSVVAPFHRRSGRHLRSSDIPRRWAQKATKRGKMKVFESVLTLTAGLYACQTASAFFAPAASASIRQDKKTTNTHVFPPRLCAPVLAARRLLVG